MATSREKTMIEHKNSYAQAGILVALAVVLISASLLVSVFSSVSETSRRAERLNTAVDMSRSVMDAYLVSENQEDFTTRLRGQGFDAENREGRTVFFWEQGERYTIELKTEDTQRGEIEHVRVSVTVDGEEVYCLESGKYQNTVADRE